MFSTKCYRSDTPPYECIILVEPPMIDRHVFQAHLEDRKRQTSMLTKAVAAQRNSWDNRKAAFEYFSRRVPWKTWDSRVIAIHIVRTFTLLTPCSLTLFISIEPRSSPAQSDDPLGAVTTKCTKYHEAAVTLILSRRSKLLNGSKRSAMLFQSTSSMAERMVSCSFYNTFS